MQQGRTRARRRSRLAVDLCLLAAIGIMLIAALPAGGITLYQQFYGPSAFVMRYLDLLADGRAADALRVPGVSVASEALSAAGVDASASEALLRSAALAPLRNIVVVEETSDGDIVSVKVTYSAGTHDGTTTFKVTQDGWAGVTPNWRFSTSPLAMVDLTVRGADQFAVNGFEMDRRQVAPAGAAAAPLDPVPLLVLTPGLYSITVDTAIAESAGIGVLADTPLATTPVDVQAQPTDGFAEIVQKRVEEFLAACTTQQVLQPTACPFGLAVANRIDSVPNWSITKFPQVTVVPDGGRWKIPAAEGAAHIDVAIRSLYDGSIELVSEDVPFAVDGSIAVLPDGSVSIRVGTPDEPPAQG